MRSFGVNVPRMLMLTYGLAVGLAGFGGVMAAPIYQVSPLMGSNLIIVVFAVVVIGGMGSILGSIVTGFGLEQGVLPRGGQRCDLRGHDPHAGLPPQWPVWPR